MGEEKGTGKAKFGKMSRGQFLKAAGLAVGGATIGPSALLDPSNAGATTETATETAAGKAAGVDAAVTASPATGIDEVSTRSITIDISVNGDHHQLQVYPRDTLRDTLRDQLGILSPKDMCNGYGACGSCSVIMNSRPVLSCMILSCECSGAVIETAEGIARAQHPIVEAYILNSCSQCGYCTPGFLVTSKALLDHNTDPTGEGVRLALSGNLCRCGTYPAHVEAVLEAANNLRKER